MHDHASPAPANQLENSASSYLRSARHQPVQWHPWGAAAFAKLGIPFTSLLTIRDFGIQPPEE